MAKIVFTELEQEAMSRNHVLGDMDIDPAEDPYIAISVLLDNSTNISQHIDEEGI